VAEHRVDQSRYQHTDNEIKNETHALRRGAGHDCDRRAAEHQLEKEEGASHPALVWEVQEDSVSAEPAPLAETEHDAESDTPEHHGRHAEVRKILRSNVDAVFSSRQAALETEEPGLHKQYEETAEHNPQEIEIGSALDQTDTPVS
jgi:hypothetical protein